MGDVENSEKSAVVLYGRPHFKLATVRAVGRSKNSGGKVVMWWAVNPISTRGTDYAPHYYLPFRIFRPSYGPDCSKLEMGSSIKYVSTFFAIFDTSLRHVSAFFLFDLGFWTKIVEFENLK